jgi:protein SCO1/2
MKKFLIACAAFALLTGITISAVAAETENKAKPIAGSTVGGAFTLVDGAGKSVTEKSWPGKYKLVFFGFTSCPEICPTTLTAIGGALEKLGAKADKIQPLFVTTDPGRDTPEVVKAYVANFDPRIVGLTGTAEQLKSAESTYKVYAAKRDLEGKDYTMDHSAFVYFMSPDDKMLAIMKGDAGASAIAEKIEPLL